MVSKTKHNEKIQAKCEKFDRLENVVEELQKDNDKRSEWLEDIDEDHHGMIG